ncbi:MAG: hypothetical protein AB1791_11890 [Chloroflexota bacterium]
MTLLVAISLLYVLLTAPNTGNPAAPGRTPLSEAMLNFVQGNLQASAASPLFPPLALLAAFLLGGLHALTPGHNKTLVGAYLVGAHGRLRHAVLIGAATAFSHTASAIVLGALALSATFQVASTQFLRWVGLPSGLLTIGLGVWLLRRHRPASHSHTHENDQAHEHGHDHEHDSEHDHEHTHGHGHSHHPPAPDRVTLGGLVVMGLMHGIVPTFDAIAILLVALNVSQAALGIGLIVSYSLGIAAVLIAIGALFIRAQGLLLESPRFEKVSNLSPLLAAVLVIILGLVLVGRTLLPLL